jgi:hypothetical protein
VNNNWRSIGGVFPNGARVSAVPAAPTTLTCSSAATMAVSTLHGGTRGGIGRG